MRPLHWLYAHLFGYFWFRCPRCGKGFGGHQCRPPFDASYEGCRVTYCPSCARTRDEWEPRWRSRWLAQVDAEGRDLAR